MKIQNLVGQNLRKLRLAKELSQNSLAADSGVDAANIARLELGQHNATITVLGKLATALGVSPSEFFAEPKKGATAPRPLKPGPKPKGIKRRG